MATDLPPIILHHHHHHHHHFHPHQPHPLHAPPPIHCSPVATLVPDWPSTTEPFLGYDQRVARRLAALTVDGDQSEASKLEHHHQQQQNHQHHYYPHLAIRQRLGDIIIRPHSYELLLDCAHFSPDQLRVAALPGAIFVRSNSTTTTEDTSKDTASQDPHSESPPPPLYREYLLPHDIDPATVTATWLAPEHILLVEAQKVGFSPPVVDPPADNSDTQNPESKSEPPKQKKLRYVPIEVEEMLS